MAREEKFPVTRAIHALRERQVDFQVALYRYEGRGEVARTAAAGVGAPEEEVYKTLVFDLGDRPALVLIDAAGTVSPSKLSAAAKAQRKAFPCDPRDAERFTGYQVGGISPFGTRQFLLVYLDELALLQDHLWVNGGSHGFMVRLQTGDLIHLLKPMIADLRQ